MEKFNFAANIPEWLNQELFETAIRLHENDKEAQILSFDLKPASKPGENFASAVFRGLIKFTSKYSKDEKEISVIIKTQPVGVETSGMEWMEDPRIFQAEIDVYCKVLSKVEKLMESAGDHDVICPK